MSDAPETKDWRYAEALFLRGFRYKEIAAQTGFKEATLRQHMKRHKLTVAAARANEIVAAQTLQEVAQLPNGQVVSTNGEMLSRSNAVRERLANDIMKTAEILPTLPHSTDVRKLHKRQQVVNEVIDGAGKLFDWGQGVNACRIDIYALSIEPGKPGSLLGPPLEEKNVTPPQESPEETLPNAS
jgi:hypothetical protein